jgi:hypothetical protein
MQSMIRLILILILTGISGIVLAQKVDLNQPVEVSENSYTIEELLHLVTEQTGVPFTYSSNVVPINDRITVSKSLYTLQDILERIILDRPLSYQISGKRIIFKFHDLRQTIKGKIYDIDTKQPIVGASVIILNSDPLLGSPTNLDGVYRIDHVPIGRVDILVKYLGYEDRYVSNVLVGSGKEVVLNVPVREAILKMEEVVVYGSKNNFEPINYNAQVSARSFSVEETKRYAASVGDPARLALSYPGVAAGDDGTNEIVIRGNAPNGLLWRLEGVEIPNPNHFSDVGASTGGISMFSTQMISRSDFLTGAFPSEYGNALSGVFDINFRNGNQDKREYTFQAGMLGLDLAVEGPIKKGDKSTFLFNYRYSTLGILSAMGFNIEGGNENNTFQDLAFKVNVPTENFGTFNVFGLGGLSDYTNSFEDSYTDREDYDMGVVGLSNTFNLNKNTFLKTTVSTSADRIIFNEQELVTFENDTLSIRDSVYYEASFIRGYHRFGTTLTSKINAKNTLEFGGVYSLLDFRFREVWNPLDTVASDTEYIYINDEGSSSTTQLFGNWNYRITESLTFTGGLHLFYFQFNNEYLYQPRASIKWNFRPNKAVSFGFGEHSRIESLEFYLGNEIMEDGTPIQHNRDLKVTKARHFVLGYNHQITQALFFKTELYYQQLYDVPVIAGAEAHSEMGAYSALLNDYQFNDDITRLDLSNSGTGTNYGIEMTLERRFDNYYYFMINGSVFDSRYTGGDGIERSTRFDAGFIANAIGGKEFKVGRNKKNILGLNVKALYTGNQRITPIDLEASRNSNAEIRDYSRAYDVSLPNYFRMDLQLSYIKNNPKATHEWRLDIQNATDRSNVFIDYYSLFRQEIITAYQTAFIPVLSYRIQF